MEARTQGPALSPEQSAAYVDAKCPLHHKNAERPDLLTSRSVTSCSMVPSRPVTSYSMVTSRSVTSQYVDVQVCYQLAW